MFEVLKFFYRVATELYDKTKAKVNVNKTSDLICNKL